MNVEFLGQPWQDGTNLDDFLAEVTSQASPNQLRIAVAWAKRSGLIRIRPHLDAWRTGGGTVAMVVGLSEGGATRQGLEMALEVADSVHLFHDLSGRTFHPKVYLAETAESTSLMVGSNNLTAGGLYFNYEAGVVVRLPADESSDATLLKQVADWFDRLLAEPACCLPLTPSNLPLLIANPAFRIGDEDKRRRASQSEVGAPEEVDAVTPTDDEDSAAFFGKSQTVKKKARYDPPSTSGASETQGSAGTGSGAKGSGSPTPILKAASSIPATPRTAIMRWSKLLKGTDAQQPPGANTQPTYNLRLAAARHDIDIKTYFRDDFFDTTPWTPDPDDPTIEYTLVEMEVFIHGTSRGTHEFRIDHDLDRVSGQGNVPTVLKWGPMSDYMLKHNHVDDWVLLEKYDDDSFALKIESTDPGTR